MRLEGDIAVVPRRGRSELAPTKTTRGWVACDGSEVTTSDGFRAPLREVECGWIVPAGAKGKGVEAVALRTGGHVVWVGGVTRADARALLETAGVDPARRALSFGLGLSLWYLAAIWGGITAAMLASMWLFLGPALRSPLALGWAALSVVTPMALIASMQQRVTVGRDGLERRKGLARDLVRIEDIADVQADDFKFEVRRRGGAPLVLWAWSPTADTSERSEKAALRGRQRLARILAERIATLRALAKGFAPGDGRYAPLDRNGRDDAAWREALSTLLTASEDYRRAAPPTADELVALVAHPDTPRERRVGAVLALRGVGDDEARRRVEPLLASMADAELVAALREALGG